jgi:hypothetical protein
MMALLFSLMTMTLMAVSVFLVFSGNTTSVLRKNYEYQVRSNTTNACLVYGDLLVRSGRLDANPRTGVPERTTVQAGCLSQGRGACTLPITCTIHVRSDNKVYVSVDK